MWSRFRDGRCAQVAASLAFTTLLSLVPFITLVAVVFSRFPQSAQFGNALKGFLLDNLLPDKAGKVIATYALQFSQKAAPLSVLGGAILIVTAVMLMRTIDQVINQIWLVRSRRPWATRLAIYWLAISFGPVLLAGGVFASSAVLSLSLELVGELAWLEALGLRVIPVFLLAGVFATLYYAVPHCSVRVEDALWGGLLASLGLVAMQRVFGLYLAHFPSYTLVYGAFAVVPIFLLWLYLSWILILFCGAFVAVLPEVRLQTRALPDFPGRRLYVALLLLLALAEVQRTGRALGVDSLAARLRVAHDELRDVLAVCERARLAARQDGGGWMLARAADSIVLVEVVRLFGLALRDEGGATDAERAQRALWNQLVRGGDEAWGASLGSLLEEGALPRAIQRG